MKQKLSIELSEDIIRTIRLECHGNIAAVTATQDWNENKSTVTLYVEELESRSKSIMELGSRLVILGMMVTQLGREAAE